MYYIYLFFELHVVNAPVVVPIIVTILRNFTNGERVGNFMGYSITVLPYGVTVGIRCSCTLAM